MGAKGVWGVSQRRRVAKGWGRKGCGWFSRKDAGAQRGGGAKGVGGFLAKAQGRKGVGARRGALDFDLIFKTVSISVVPLRRCELILSSHPYGSPNSGIKMLSDKLFSLLTAFSKVELNRFRKFLLSPYLNEQEDATRLFDLLDEALRKKEKTDFLLSKTAVWAALYPDKKMDDAQLRRLFSDLTQLALRFMAAEMRSADARAEALDLQKALDNPRLTKHLAGVERQLLRLFDQTERHSTDFFLAQFKMHHHVFVRASKGVTTIGYGDKLAMADHYLECFYLIQKLKYYVAWLQFSGIRATEKIVRLLPGFWENMDDERYAAFPLLAIYRRIAACFTLPDDVQHFYGLLNDLDIHSKNLTKEDLQECYHIAQNYCALKISQGRLEYYREVFQIFQKMIHEGILLENEHLSEGMFKNIITASLGVGEFQWAEQFIETYAIYLPSAARENARSFNLAYLYFHQKKFDNVVRLLQDIEYSDIAYALGAKQMLLRTYYETNEVMAMDSLIDSFRIFIRRSTMMTKNLKREYNNFLSFLRIIATLNQQDKSGTDGIKKKIAEAQYLNSKKWLLEKLAEREAMPGSNPRKK